MEQEKNFDWFKREIIPILDNYKIEYRYYKEGDFGELNQIILESSKLGGQIDFWGLGWIGIHIIDCEEFEDLINVLIEPESAIERDTAFDKLLALL